MPSLKGHMAMHFLRENTIRVHGDKRVFHDMKKKGMKKKVVCVPKITYPSL